MDNQRGGKCGISPWIVIISIKFISFHHIFLKIFYPKFKSTKHIENENVLFNIFLLKLFSAFEFNYYLLKKSKDLPPVRLELTAFRLWDWRAAYCATEAWWKKERILCWTNLELRSPKKNLNFSKKTMKLFSWRVSNRVSVQGVKSLGGHFACSCRGFDFHEVKKKYYYYFSKRKGKYFYTFNHFYREKS